MMALTAKRAERWEFERSSGFAGYRCHICGTWRYEDAELRCDCSCAIGEASKQDLITKLIGLPHGAIIQVSLQPEVGLKLTFIGQLQRSGAPADQDEEMDGVEDAKFTVQSDTGNAVTFKLRHIDSVEETEVLGGMLRVNITI